jgi:hypothetical protein
VIHADTIYNKFRMFHMKHPEVYRELVKLARQWVAAGHHRLGIKTLFERLRWEWHISGISDTDGFKLNNNFAPYYARLIMEENPELDGLFELRQIRAVA